MKAGATKDRPVHPLHIVARETLVWLESQAPVVLQDVQTDHPLAVDVAVVDPRAKRLASGFIEKKSPFLSKTKHDDNK